ncbi:hypothetical protein [Nitrosomonas oligotropha]|uniref:hypothetical protein n=1 Tax=Nitrosomonas oligotropha TaxID=42354 RepID=UPI00136EF41A|nr:hypothetical protein [Nitrosomonas oligotropha]MXS83354.1 hypothetical protein [Nitrosomonas oligotropha]
MSRKRLGDELDELLAELTPRKKREEAGTSYQESLNNPDSLAYRLNKYVEQLSDEERRKIFAGIYEIAFDAYEEEYLAGDLNALMKCISFCCTEKLVLPNWAAKAFHEGYTKISNREAKSWDVVFGKPNKGRHKAKRSEEENIKIYLYIREQVSKGSPIDEGLFSDAAEQFDGYSTEMKKIYYHVLKHGCLRWKKSMLEGTRITHAALELLDLSPWQKEHEKN